MLDHSEMVPPVRLEPCLRFVDEVTAPGGVCAVCGWLLHDHDEASQAALAVVTPLPRRPRLRRAS